MEDQKQQQIHSSQGRGALIVEEVKKRDQQKGTEITNLYPHKWNDSWVSCGFL